MDLSERFIWLAFGCVVGFVLGYIVRALSEIKEELDSVDECVKHCREDHEHMVRRQRNERGVSTPRYALSVSLALVVGLTAYAAYLSGKAVNDIEETQGDLAQITICNQKFLGQTVDALNERTTSNQERANANVELQKAQSAFLTVIIQRPGPTPDEYQTALQTYFDKLTEFLVSSNEADQDVMKNPYPTNEELMECLSE